MSIAEAKKIEGKVEGKDLTIAVVDLLLNNKKTPEQAATALHIPLQEVLDIKSRLGL